MYTVKLTIENLVSKVAFLRCRPKSGANNVHAGRIIPYRNTQFDKFKFQVIKAVICST